MREVVLLGRRGPAQAAFTNPELLELGALARADVVVDPDDLHLDDASATWLASDKADKTARRNVEIHEDYAQRAPSHRIVLRLLGSPVEILGDERGRVTGLRAVRNRIEPGEDGGLPAVPTSELETIPCGMVVRSIGYRGQPLAGIPFDDRRGLIRNAGGGVTDERGAVLPGEYVVGWIKRGPSGVIGTNKKCATDTVARILEDREACQLPTPRCGAGPEVEAWLRDRVERLVTWDGWSAIDAHEIAVGDAQGRPRVKVVRVDEMHEVAARRATRVPR